MMNEEMNNEVMEQEVDMVETYEEPETKESGIVKKSLFALAGVAAVGLAAKGAMIAKSKYEDYTVNRLKKKGYIVVNPENVGEVINEEEEKETSEEPKEE